ncbi:LPS export ABC transporter permease LptF [Desulfonema ishimotonii]|uniref:LPS export ABC transporter permease LptF n=1 Tax=Desulfonema ishimotonii TaxID=45657 RepID=A0A401G3N5_9BACT|nr:LPS export ABC transporter permease LptF [Desulfonema ishimotonii]GBC63826.1 LPS export ABC transporter permease LptF [Desulfonema ishimotonii]
MKSNAIVNRYILKELIPPFALNVMFFTFVFLLTEILEITNMIVNYNVDLFSVLRMLAYSMPYFLVFVLPMSVMMAVLLTFLRMSSDNEIIALKSVGVSLYQMLPPVFLFCLMGCLLTGWMSIYGLPWGRLSLKKLTVEVARSNIDIGLKERTFNNSFKGVMLYVSRIDLKSKALIDVFIQDDRTAKTMITVIAPRGQIFSDPEHFRFQMRLFNGMINQVDLKTRKVNTINFETYDLNLDLEKAVEKVSGGPKNEKEMSLSELRHYLKTDTKRDSKYYNVLIMFHKKFSIPFACFALGLLAIPLGIQSKAARKSVGLGLGLALFLLYYLLLSAGQVFGETGFYPPLIGMWVPNIVTGGIGLCLLVRTVRGRPVYIDLIPYLFKWLKR